MFVKKVPAFKLASLLLALGLMSTLVDTTEAKNKEDAVELSNSNFSGEVDSGNQTVNISGSNSVVTVAGVPTTLNVDGSNNEAKVPSGCLSVFVNGSNNKVFLGLAKKITLDGSNNIIYWSKTTSGKPPEVANRGANNKIARSSEQTNSLSTDSNSLNTKSNSISTTSVSKTGSTRSSSQTSVEAGPNGIHIRTTDGSNIDMH